MLGKQVPFTCSNHRISFLEWFCCNSSQFFLRIEIALTFAKFAYNRMASLRKFIHISKCGISFGINANPSIHLLAYRKQKNRRFGRLSQFVCGAGGD